MSHHKVCLQIFLGDVSAASNGQQLKKKYYNRFFYLHSFCISVKRWLNPPVQSEGPKWCHHAPEPIYPMWVSLTTKQIQTENIERLCHRKCFRINILLYILYAVAVIQWSFKPHRMTTFCTSYMWLHKNVRVSGLFQCLCSCACVCFCVCVSGVS